MNTRPDLALDERMTNLLLASARHLKAARGDDLFRAAWIHASKGTSAALLSCDEDAVPASNAAAARGLFVLALELGNAAGISRSEFTGLFNDIGEAGHVSETLDAVIERGFGYLLAMAAMRQAEIAADTDAPSQVSA